MRACVQTSASCEVQDQHSAALIEYLSMKPERRGLRKAMLWVPFLLATSPGAIIADVPARDPAFNDHAAPVLSWWVEEEGARGAQGFHSAAARMSGDIGVTYIIFAEGRDEAALSLLSLSGVGRFRCASLDGTWTTPDDIVLPLPNLAATRQVTLGTKLHKQGRIQARLHVAEISCGMHRVPGKSMPQELFAVSGKILLSATATDLSGRSMRATLQVEAAAASPRPQAVLAVLFAPTKISSRSRGSSE